jgi:O-acetyl-ADP-ribose deacetylase (regulator of RNase III)
MKTIKGDLIQLAKQGEFDVIAHGCNCFCTMGSGIAKSIRLHFPQAYKADMQTKKGDAEKLGTCSYAETEELVIINAYTQFNYGRGRVFVDYKAVRNCMKWIAKNYPKSKIGLPKIGAGLAGGDWDKIQEIIEEEMGDLDVTIVEYKI